jgi:hypothetical protein
MEIVVMCPLARLSGADEGCLLGECTEMLGVQCNLCRSYNVCQ